MSSTKSVKADNQSYIRESPSAERNKEPIWSILSKEVLPPLLKRERESNVEEMFRVVEVAAGCGVHTIHFASKLSSVLEKSSSASLEWVPTDPDLSSRSSIDARVQLLRSSNDVVRDSRSLTLDENGIIEGRHQQQQHPLSDWENEEIVDLIICINMIHISPWTATIGLMNMASRNLRSGGILFCYGPYKVDGTAAPSNLDFDKSLRMRDATWGVRDLEDVVTEAEKNGLLTFVKKVEMPANNLSLIFCKK